MSTGNSGKTVSDDHRPYIGIIPTPYTIITQYVKERQSVELICAIFQFPTACYKTLTSSHLSHLIPQGVPDENPQPRTAPIHHLGIFFSAADDNPRHLLNPPAYPSSLHHPALGEKPSRRRTFPDPKHRTLRNVVADGPLCSPLQLGGGQKKKVLFFLLRAVEFL
ncbi:hypothetical protein TNCV_1170711 [Trichonephila clavipes]|nr:hypothetical protein TNCV_1170711 [Trichonephila clavipes]